MDDEGRVPPVATIGELQYNEARVTARHSLSLLPRFYGDRQALRLKDRQYRGSRRKFVNAYWPVLHSSSAVAPLES